MDKTNKTAEQLYRQMFEKYAKRDQERSVLAIISGTLGVLGVVLSVLRLRELRADRQAAGLIREHRP